MPEVVPKLLARHVVQHPVPERVRGDLVARRINFQNQFGMLPGHVTQDEKRGLGMVSIEKAEDLPGALDDAARVIRPIVATDVSLEVRNVVVVFHVDRHGINYLHCLADSPNERILKPSRKRCQPLSIAELFNCFAEMRMPELLVPAYD